MRIKYAQLASTMTLVWLPLTIVLFHLTAKVTSLSCIDVSGNISNEPGISSNNGSMYTNIVAPNYLPPKSVAHVCCNEYYSKYYFAPFNGNVIHMSSEGGSVVWAMANSAAAKDRKGAAKHNTTAGGIGVLSVKATRV